MNLISNPLPSPFGRLLRVGLALAAAACAGWAMAEPAFPSRPVTIVVPLTGGSATDGLMRILAQQLGARWRTAVIVVNKPGATGMVAAAAVAKAAPDGYTLLAMTSSQVVGEALMDKAPVDLQHALRPVVRIGSVPLVLCVRSSLDVDSVADLVALARSKPGQINFGSPGKGSTTHLASALFAKAAGIQLTHVPYSATSQAQSDLLAGQLDMLFVIPAVAQQFGGGDRARCLMTESPVPLPQFPHMPTEKQAGLHPLEVHDWIGLVAPAGLPQAVAQQLSADVLAVLGEPETKKKINALGVNVDPMTAAEFTGFYQEDFARWAGVLKQIGLSSASN